MEKLFLLFVIAIAVVSCNCDGSINPKYAFGNDVVTPCEQPPQMDIIFVIDSSSNIEFNEPNYQYIREFLMNMISILIPHNSTRVGIVLFGDNASLTYPLTFNFTSAYAKLEKVPLLNGGTNISEALEIIQQEFNQTERAGIAKVAILITDGKPAAYSHTEVALTELEIIKIKDSGVNLFTIGVGEMAEKALSEWASSPSFMHYYKFDNFSQLASSFPAVLKAQLCKVSIFIPYNQECVTGVTYQNQSLFYQLESYSPKIAYSLSEHGFFITFNVSKCSSVLYVSKTKRFPSNENYYSMLNGTLNNPTITYVFNDKIKLNIFISVVGSELENHFTFCRYADEGVENYLEGDNVDSEFSIMDSELDDYMDSEE